jgi:hypothetical protein
VIDAAVDLAEVWSDAEDRERFDRRELGRWVLLRRAHLDIQGVLQTRQMRLDEIEDQLFSLFDAWLAEAAERDLDLDLAERVFEKLAKIDRDAVRRALAR